MIKDNRTIIEITNTYIKLLQVNMQRGLPHLFRLDIFETKNRSEQQLSESLSKAGIKSRNTILVIPKRNVILKQFSFPSHNEAEIEKMLGLKVLQQVPFSQEEIVFDHITLEKTQDGYTKVLTAISPIEQIASSLKIAEKAGLTVTNVLISSFGIIGWFRHLIPQEEKPVGILNLDYDGTELCFCQEGKFLFSRNFNFGLSDLNDKNISDMLHQVELTLKAYHAEFPQKDIEKMFIVSDIFQIELLKNGIVERFNLAVETIRPSERIPCELQVLSLIKNHPMVSITGAWGFVISPADNEIDLKPNSLQKTEPAGLKIKELLLFFLSAAVFLALIVAALNIGAYQKYLHLKDLKNKLASIQTNAANDEEKLKNIDKITALVKRGRPVADVLRDVHQKTPPEVSFTRLHWEDLSLTIEGITSGRTAVEAFQKALQDLPWFKNVAIEQIRAKRNDNKEFFEFKIICLGTSS